MVNIVARTEMSFEQAGMLRKLYGVRSRFKGRLVACMVLTGLLLPSALPMQSRLPTDTRVRDGVVFERPDKTVPKADVQTSLKKIPLYFIENQGQVDHKVSYYVEGNDMTTYFADGKLTFALTGSTTPPASDDTGEGSSRLNAIQAGPRKESLNQRWAVRLEFPGANENVKPIARDQTSSVINYFRGIRQQWKTGLKTYSTLVYPDLWPGIDLVCSGAVNQLKYSFMVHPGADANQIKMAYYGATGVTLNHAGQLEVKTPVGGFTDDKPYSYQEAGGQHVEVFSAYKPESRGEAEAQVWGFTIGDYDKSKLLVVDPTVAYAGFIGGYGDDISESIAVDNKGFAYLTGSTNSDELSFPAKVGPDLTYNKGFRDAFIAKVNTSGGSLVYASYIGGSDQDEAMDIAVDCTHNAYITGFTRSTQATLPVPFPVLTGPDIIHNGDFDAFVVKVNAAGTAIMYAGYIGGGTVDAGSGIAVDEDGNAYVAGYSDSAAGTFPDKSGPALNNKGGKFDAFVAKVNAMGTGLDYAGFIGGFGWDEATDIAVDGAKNAYVTGFTNSSPASFPKKGGPSLFLNQNHNAIEFDAFVAKVNITAVLEYAGYIGGASDDRGFGIAVNSAGNAYITGQTQSSPASFPEKGGPFLILNQGSASGAHDAFVAKVNIAGSGLDYAGYVGGSASDHGDAIAVNNAGNAYITGQTTSSAASFPEKVGPFLTFNLGSGSTVSDGFVAKVSTLGDTLEYASYLGGTSADGAKGIAVDKDGNAYVSGFTQSSDFPTMFGPDLIFKGKIEAFVIKIK